MINVRAQANRLSSRINPNITVALYKSDGYTIGAGRKQVPKYEKAADCLAQVQALDGVELKQIDGLNIQGTIRAIYLYPSVSGVSAPNGTGGDLIKMQGQTWLVVRVLEAWPTFTKAAIVLQEGELCTL